MKVTVYINKINQESGREATVTAANGGEYGPPLLQLQMSNHRVAELGLRLGMPITMTLEFDR